MFTRLLLVLLSACLFPVMFTILIALLSVWIGDRKLSGEGKMTSAAASPKSCGSAASTVQTRRPFWELRALRSLVWRGMSC